MLCFTVLGGKFLSKKTTKSGEDTGGGCKIQSTKKIFTDRNRSEKHLKNDEEEEHKPGGLNVRADLLGKVGAAL